MTGHCNYLENFAHGYAYQGVLCEVGQGFSKFIQLDSVTGPLEN